MNRVVLSIVGVIIFVLAACVILTFEKKENEMTSEQLDLTKVNQREAALVKEQNGQPAPTLPAEIETHYDSAALNKKVKDMAQKLGKDENTYRMFVRQEPDQSQIYRQIGMFVIVDPSGEEYFLPDEI